MYLLNFNLNFFQNYNILYILLLSSGAGHSWEASSNVSFAQSAYSFDKKQVQYLLLICTRFWNFLRYKEISYSNYNECITYIFQIYFIVLIFIYIQDISGSDYQAGLLNNHSINSVQSNTTDVIMVSHKTPPLQRML